MRLAPVALLAAALTGGPGCATDAGRGADLVPATGLSHYRFDAPSGRWTLPDELAEVSGLVDDGEGGLLAHHDNGAALWRLAPGATLEIVAVPGAPGPPGDFEGLARRGDALWLLGSPGLVYRATLSPGGTTAWRQATVLRGVCGFEGIETAPDGGLLLACKYPRAPRTGHVLLVRVAADAAQSEVLAIDVAPVLNATGLRRLRPSGLAWLPARAGRAGGAPARLLVLAGKERVLLEVDAEAGRLLAWRRLLRARHRQAEGIAVLADGAIVIADEADGRAATLTRYAPAPP
ncbi:MAG: hypothetical protein CMQ43_07970 [Gammaproteobacteria bacterium]|nr:hypothetical protein [Gammaproteobacteria bacterium]